MFGFSIADPVNKDGLFQRTHIQIDINLRSDGKAYSENDLDMLSRVDTEVERLEKRRMSK